MNLTITRATQSGMDVYNEDEKEVLWMSIELPNGNRVHISSFLDGITIISENRATVLSVHPIHKKMIQVQVTKKSKSTEVSG